MKPSKTLGFILVGSFLFRLWFAFGYWSGKPITQDAQEYLELAKNLNAKNALVYDEHPGEKTESPGRAPGYPFWLALLMRVSPALAWIRFMEILVSLVTSALFFVLARDLFSHRAGLAALMISSFYAPVVWLIPPILSENLWIPFVLCGYWLLLTAQKNTNGKTWKGAVAFVLLATATLIRPGSVFLLPLYLLWTYRTTGFKQAIVCGLLYFLVLLPWNLHLHQREGRWIFVASEGAVTFWTGSHPGYSGDGDLAENPPVQEAYRELLKQNPDQSPADRDRAYVQMSKQNILSDPAGYLLIEFKKLLFWFIPVGRSIRVTSLLHQITGMLFYGCVLIFALSGFPKVPPDTRSFFLWVLFSFTVMALIFLPQERFRIATIDPILILAASADFVDKKQD